MSFLRRRLGQLRHMHRAEQRGRIKRRIQLQLESLEDRRMLAFSTPTNFGVGTKPAWLGVGDLNGDGKLDVVSANGDSNNVSVRLGNGVGGFGAATTFSVGVSPNSVAIGDLNGDGKPDLAVANVQSNSVSVLLGTGTGSFGTATNISVGTNPYAVKIADLNGDGKPDLVTANRSSNDLSFLAGTGNGSFIPTSTLPVGSTPYSVDVGDFNGDGRPDLVASNTFSNNISLLLGTGGGNFSAATNFPVSAQPFLLSTGDFNGDGKPDVVTANYATSNISVLLGTGAGSFGAATKIPLPNQPRGLTVGDVNGDGKLDLVTVDAIANNMSVKLGTGDGGFGAATILTTGRNPFHSAIADFNGDGRPDVVTANAGDNAFSLFLNTYAAVTSLPFMTATSVSVGTNPSSVLIGDINRDGKPDMATANAKSNNVSVRLGNGNGSFGTESIFPVGSAPSSVAIGDINGDGKPDLVASNYGDNNVSVLLGTDTPALMGTAINFAVGIQPQFVTVSDVNRDGKPDILTANIDNTVSVLLGTGAAGLFGTATNIAVGGRQPSSLAIADVNRDGRPDLVTVLSGDDTVSVRLGTGNASLFGTAVNFSEITARSVAIGDVNRDGLPDLVTSRGGLDTVSVRLGTGTAGLFGNAVSFNVGTGPNSVVIRDLNGDGKPDLGVSNRLSNDLSVLLGTGTGSFSAPSNFAVGTAPTSVAAGDLNGDGELDIITSNYNSSNVSVLLGTPPNLAPTAVVLTPATVSLPENTSTTAATELSTITITDDGVGTNNLSLSGTDAASFEIVGNKLRLKAGVALDFETKSSYSVRVNVDDPNVGSTPDAFADFTLAITNVNDAPTAVTLSPGTLGLPATTSTANPIVLSTIGITDDALGVNTLSLSGTDAASFEIVGVNLRLKADVDFKSKLSYTVRVNVDDTTIGATPDAFADFTLQRLQNFSDPTNFNVGNSPQAVTVGDFNGDGIVDMASANSNSNNVSVRLGTGNGSFGVASSFAVSNGPRTIATGDFNRDGKLDLVTANSTAGNVSVLIGSGTGSFVVTPFAAGTNCTSVTVGDFNGDGKLDLATTNFGTSRVSVLLGTGSGTFGVATSFAVGANAFFVTTADFNGDGKLDLATANANDNNVSVLLGTGNGSFGIATRFNTGSNPGWLAVGDFNGDGKPDIASANNYSNNVSVLIGTGTGAFAAASNFATDSGPIAVTLADFNGDGKKDLVTTNKFPGDVSVLLGTGTGSFGAATNFVAGSGAYSSAVGDFNGDGKPDLITANSAANSVSVLLNNYNAVTSLPFEPASNLAVGTFPLGMSVGDFNGDGKPDLVTANVNSNSLSVLLGTGAGTFAAPTSIAGVGNTGHLTVGDFNGDGKPDLAVSNSDGTYHTNVLMGTGSGTFGAPTSVSFAFDNLTVADLNRDGKLDLIGSNGIAKTIGVALGTGTGSFGAPTSVSLPNAPSSIAVRDFNGDGIPDVVTANYASNKVTVLLGTGTGGLGSPISFSTGAGPSAVVAEDLNGDGKLDLATPNFGSSTVSVLLGTGTGSFDVATDFAVGSSPAGILARDFNGDGKVDIATANAVGNNVSILLGTGTGSFSVATNFTAGNGAFAVVAADFNGDGKQDIATTNAFANSVSILLGRLNNAPTAIALTPAAVSLAENASTTAATEVSTIAFTDDGLGTNTLSLSGADAASFEIVGTKLRLKAGVALNFEAKPIYSVRVNVDDPTVGATPDAFADFTLTLTDVNEAATAVTLSPTSASLAENSSTTIAIDLASIVVTDDALGTNTLSLSGPDAASFQIVGGKLQLKAGVTLNYEAKSSYTVRVNVDDPTVGTTPDAFIDFTLNITDVNEAPTALTLSPSSASLAENTNTGSAIALSTIGITDDGQGVNTFSLSGADASSFEIVLGKLQLKSGVLLDFESQSSYTVRVNVDDATVGTTPDAFADFTLTITDVNEAPIAVFLTPASVSLPENSNTTTAVILSQVAIKDDALGVNTVTLSGPDAANFEVVGTKLRLKAGTVLDFESKSSYSVRVIVDDTTVGATPDAFADFTLTVTDVNEPPTLSLTPSFASLPENSSTTSAIDLSTIVVTNDALGNNVLTLSGTDAASFQISRGKLQLKAGTAINFEAKSSYTVRVNVDDPTVGTTPDAFVDFTLTITDVNEAPTAVTLTPLSASLPDGTNTTNAIVLSTIAVVDDALGVNTLSLSGTDAASFEIVAGKLQLKAGVALNFATKSSYSVRVSVDDTTVGATPDAFADFVLTIVSVNAAPTAVTLSPASASLAENTSTVSAIVLSTIGITDDGQGVNTLSLSGADAASFEIVAGKLQLKSGVLLDFESKSTYAVRVNVDDTAVGTTPDAFADFTLSVTDMFELSGIDVQNGQSQRSFVRNVDILFDSASGINSLLSGNRIKMTRFDLNGVNGVALALPTVTTSGNSIKLDFGAQGIGGNRSTTAGDGYYEIGVDMDGDGSFETTKHFFRLLGDVTGDGIVDGLDKAQVLAAQSTLYSPEGDVNGDGVVNSADTSLMVRSANRRIKDGLTRDD